MTGFTQNVSDRTLRAWLNAGPVDKGIGGGLIFFAKEASACQGQATWILRYRIGNRRPEKVLGRYPDISLKEARELARRDRALIQQGVDVSAKKRQDKLKALEMEDVRGLGQIWYERHILKKIKNPAVVERVLRRHIYPVIGKLAINEVRPHHIDAVLNKIVEGGAPTVANDAMRYLFRMFHYAAKRRWTEANPVAGFDLSDAGGTELPRERWLSYEDLVALAKDMRDTPNFGRINELATWLLLALCVRKMELLSAKVADFDLEKGVWKLLPNRTKTKMYIEIPLSRQAIEWLRQVIAIACGSEYLFPARRLIRMRNGIPRKNRFEHISPDTLNVALKRLPRKDIEHFTVHDMRRTARTQLSALGVEPFVAERALNHKLPGRQGIYDKHDYFVQRKKALRQWAEMLGAISRDEPIAFPSEITGFAEDDEKVIVFTPTRLPPALTTKIAANE
ncbi:tyrosine-type recombinase/integrase [Paucibacter sp. O1-1]|nr:tyrosine-type recombinase/integrase [Paucibacter sp. O1-1]MDA3824521.1 tyrosine-type recombinase/integrase [Paucibacter sp. O1-1]